MDVRAIAMGRFQTKYAGCRANANVAAGVFIIAFLISGGCIGDRSTEVFVTNQTSEDLNVSISRYGRTRRPTQIFKAGARSSLGGAYFQVGDDAAVVFGKAKRGTILINGENITDAKCELYLK